MVRPNCLTLQRREKTPAWPYGYAGVFLLSGLEDLHESLEDSEGTVTVVQRIVRGKRFHCVVADQFRESRQVGLFDLRSARSQEASDDLHVQAVPIKDRSPVNRELSNETIIERDIMPDLPAEKPEAFVLCQPLTELLADLFARLRQRADVDLVDLHGRGIDLADRQHLLVKGLPDGVELIIHQNHPEGDDAVLLGIEPRSLCVKDYPHYLSPL